MGLFCASIHFKTADARAVKRALSETVDDPEVLDAAGGWVSAYAPGLLERFETERKHPAAFVSHRLGLRSVSFSVYDSDIARYWLHSNGELRDSFNSWPGYFEDAAPQPAGGDPAELLSLCEPGTDPDTIRRVLQPDSVFADDIVAGLAELVGINDERALQDHRDLHAPPTSRGRDRGLSNVLADLPLSGVRYCTPSHEGVTDRSGSFSYRAGELVTFSLGGFVLGTTQGRSEVSPVELIDDARVLRALLLSQRQIANR